MKTCTVCNQDKSLDEFYSYKNSKDGKSYRCKVCDNLARQKWQKNNPEKSHLSQRERNLKHRFGVDLEWYQKQLKKQNYCCAICKTKENKVTLGSNKSLSFAVDHNHDTGEVRGLLCNQCNRALGLFKDSSKVLQNAVKYLTKAQHE